MNNNSLIKNPFVLFNVVVFLLFVSLSGHAQRGGQSIQQKQSNELKRIGVMVGQGKPNSEVQEAWKKTINNYKDINIDNAINSILSEAKLEAQRNVDAAKKRVQFNSLLKQQVSNEINSAKLNLSEVGKTKEPKFMARKTFRQGLNGKDTLIVSQTGQISTQDELSVYIHNLEQQLNSIGDDAQLANIDLQNALQKQQQLIQLLSNVSKMLNDTAMAVIRKIGG
jgi:hypothetical protein